MDSLKPSVLIVILNYGTYQMTIDLIGELKQKLDYGNYSIMVVDNCSPNESAEVLENKKDELGYIFYANDSNAGYAAGNNIGIRYGIEHGFDYSWILNNDVEIRERNVLEHMVGIAERDEKIGCIGPMIYTLDGTICAPFIKRPSFWDMTLGAFSDKKKREKCIKKAGEVYRVYGCCMLLRNKAMTDIGCMDERTFLYCEEQILSERLMKCGYTNYYAPEVSITHKESSTMKTMSKNSKDFKIRESENSREIYLREYRGFSKPVRYVCHLVRRIMYGLR